MDVGTNKTRKDTRAVVSLVARYRSPSTFEYVEEACCDVSLGGMFIRSADPAAAGTLLKLECESGVGEQIRGVARVVWLRAQQNEYGPSGMGVKFVKLDPESRDVIRRIVQELAEAGIESPSMSSAPEQRGKPPAKRGTSSTPAAAEPAASPAPPRAAEIRATRPLSASPGATNDVAVLQRASDRAAATPPPPPSSSKPPVPGVSRPAPSNALLARANVEPLEVQPVPSLGTSLSTSPPLPEVGRNLAPLQAMVRARVSSEPPAEERSGRAFWLVAGAVVALGAIVALLSMRAAREDAAEDAQANVEATPAVEAPAPTAMNQVDPAPSEPAQGEAPSEPSAELPAQPTEQATAPADQFADPAQIAAAEPAAAPSDVAQAPGAAQENPQSSPQNPQGGQAEAAPDTTPGKVAPSGATTTAAQPSANSNPPPAAARPVLNPPVLRIVPADPAPTDPPEAQPQAATQQPSAPATNNNPAPAQQPNAPAATSSTTPAASPQPSTNNVAPPPLPPGEIARVILFTSRPSGATVYVGEQSVVTPGELNLGAMPARIRVTAQKEGYEPSTVWINNTAEFQKVGNVMRREAHFVLKALPPGAAAPGQPAPAAPQSSASANAAPGASSPAAPTTVPSQP